MKHLNIRISGKVQGVWYRESAKRQAKNLGIYGFVKNMPDGSVYSEAEGTEDALKTYILWCRRGPELAQVDEIQVEETDWKGFSHFEVLR